MFAELAEAGKAQATRDGIAPDAADFAYLADLRYVGQEHTIAIPVQDPAAAQRRLRGRCARRSTPSTTSATARPRPTSGWRSSTCGWS